MYCKISKYLNIISTIFLVVMLCFLAVFNGISNGTTFNGVTILIGLCMGINPIMNLYRSNKKVISNFVYHIFLIIISITISGISIIGIIKYFVDYQIDYGNAANLYFSDKLIYMIVGIVLAIIFSLFCKKESIQKQKDNFRIMFLTVAITSSLPILNDVMTLFTVLSIGVSVFSFIMIFKINNIAFINDLQKIFIILLILCLITSNIIGFILIINMYIKLDNFKIKI